MEESDNRQFQTETRGSPSGAFGGSLPLPTVPGVPGAAALAEFRYARVPPFSIPLIGVFSMGLAYPAYFYLVGRELGWKRGRSILWAVGIIVPLLGLALHGEQLFQLERRARALGHGTPVDPNRHMLAMFIAGILGYALLGLGWWLAPPGVLGIAAVIASLVVFFIPLAILQSVFRQLDQRTQGQVEVRRRQPWALAAALVAGLAVEAWVGAISDGAGPPWGGDAVASGVRVVSRSKTFSIEVRSAGWRRLEAGDSTQLGIGSVRSEMKLAGPDGASLVAYEYVGRSSLDALADARRQRITAELGERPRVEETRSFLPYHDHVPFSIARYGSSGAGGTLVYWVGTALFPQSSVELVVRRMTEGAGFDASARALLETLRVEVQRRGAPRSVALESSAEQAKRGATPLGSPPGSEPKMSSASSASPQEQADPSAGATSAIVPTQPNGVLRSAPRPQPTNRRPSLSGPGSPQKRGRADDK